MYKRLRSLLSWDAGLKFGPLPQPFTTLTAAYKRPVGRWTLHLIEQGYWQAGDGFGEITEMTNYRLLTSYTTRLHRPWLFATLSPQIDFPREEQFTFTPSIGFALSAYFGKDP